MTRQRGETTNSDFTFKEYKYMYYKRLKDGKVKVMLSENVFKCPYCPDSREYSYEEELCRRASRMARESKSAGLKEKAKHIGLLEFLMLEEMRKRREELERKISMTDYLMDSVMKQKDVMLDNFNRDVKVRQEQENEEIKEIIIKYEQIKLQLEEQEKELRAREAINENENEKLEKEKKMNESAILEQKKKANERMLKLADNHKREKEKLHQRIMELQKELDDKQRLELEIIQLKGAIMDVIKHKTDEDVEAKKKFESIKEDLKEKQGELESLKDLNQALIVREQKSNDELQDARQELIAGMKDNPSRAVIGVKRMGNLDRKPFMDAAKRRCLSEEDATEFVCMWEDHVRDPGWHPFKVITITGARKEMLNEDDEKLAKLKAECDEDVYNAVVTALNECKQSGISYPVSELWNNRDEKKATLKEGVEFLLKQWKFYKHKKRG